MNYSFFRNLALLSLAFLLFGVVPSWGNEEGLQHHGYIFDVENEQSYKSDSLFVVFDVDDLGEKPLRERIFNETLTEEFKERYEITFGRTQSELHLELLKPDGYFYDERGIVVTSETQREKQRSFGEYMIRRLFEYHLDNYMKEDPQTKTVWEMKDKFQTQEVTIAKGYKIKTQYSIASNSLKTDIDTPIVDAKVVTEIKGNADAESLNENSIYSIIRRLSKNSRIIAHYRGSNDVFGLTGRRRISDNVSTDLTVYPNFLSGDENPREVFGIAGMNVTF